MTGTTAAKTAALFTPETANKALPYVKAVVEDLVEACARLRQPGEGRGVDDARRAARETIARVKRELEAVGVEVKDEATGLLDFPGELDGRRVYLCWKRGEERVAFWHDIETGFRGRRPLPSAGASPESAPR